MYDKDNNKLQEMICVKINTIHNCRGAEISKSPSTQVNLKIKSPKIYIYIYK